MNLTALNGLASQGRWAYVLATLRQGMPSLPGDVAQIRFDNDVRPLADPEPTRTGSGSVWWRPQAKLILWKPAMI